MDARWLAVAGAALAFPNPAQADLTITGHGFGHGIGMSQYGAYGYALKTRHTHAYILAHFYPGTRLGKSAWQPVRVLLKQAPSLLVSEATRLVATGHRPITLRPERTYRFDPTANGLRVVDTRLRRTVADVASPAKVTAANGIVRLRGQAQNGIMSGRYRSELWLSRDGATVTAVNRLGIERYLYGVVPAEMPSVWPLEALKAQAVAARSYALRSLRPADAVDVFADVRSQVYKGVAGETARTRIAVDATAGEAVFYGSQIATTYFHSSSGGRTADIAEEWGGAPVPYLRSVADPYDYLSPDHSWSVTFTADAAQRRLGSLVLGDLLDMRVSARNSSGRAALVQITGSGGVTTATGAQIRTALGLRSTWFDIRMPAAMATSGHIGTFPASGGRAKPRRMSRLYAGLLAAAG